MDRTNNGIFQEANFRTRLSPIDSYNGPYMHEIESMKRARDYLLWWCRTSNIPVWNKIYISTTVHTGTRYDGFGEASSKFSYADVPNHDVDDSVPSVDVPYDNLVENEDNVLCTPTSGHEIVEDETEVPHECLHVMPGCMPTIQSEEHSSSQVVSPSFLEPCTPIFNDNTSQAKQHNMQRINSSWKEYSICMDELNANISDIGYNNVRPINSGTSYCKSPDSSYWHTHANDTNNNNNCAHFAVAPSKGNRNKRSHSSAFGSTHWQTNLNEPYDNDNYFSHAETMSSSYCKRNRLYYNSAYYDFSKSQTNQNYSYGYNYNVNYVETPSPVSYHDRRFFNNTSLQC